MHAQLLRLFVTRMGGYVCVCVIGFGVWTVSVSVRLVCYGPARQQGRQGAAVSGLHHGSQGLAPAPRFQLYVRCAGPRRARGGCRAPVSVSGASVAQGAV